jgi:hypothetical protein
MLGGLEGLPFTQLDTEATTPGLAHATPTYVVKDCLRNLKMGFWPWEWAPQVSFLGDATSSLGDATSSLGDAKSSLGDAESSLGDTKSSLGDAKSSLG